MTDRIDMKSIRNDFKRKFYQLAKQEKIEIINEWKIPIPEDDTLLLKWKSEDLKKIMTIQEENPDATFKFDYVVDKTGLHFEYDYILVCTRHSHKQVELILALYKSWFIENKTPEEMEHLLEEYFTKLNRHSSEYYERLFEEISEPVEEDALVRAIEAQMSDTDDEEQRGGT